MVQWLHFSPVTQGPGVRFPTGEKVALPSTELKLHMTSGTAEKRRGGPTTLTQVVADGNTDGHV